MTRISAIRRFSISPKHSAPPQSSSAASDSTRAGRSPARSNEARTRLCSSWTSRGCPARCPALGGCLRGALQGAFKAAKDHTTAGFISNH